MVLPRHPLLISFLCAVTAGAADLVKDFLGRSYNTKAFEKFLAE